MPSGGVMLHGGLVLSEGEASLLDFSDVSSVITIGDRLAPSDTEDDDRAAHQDTQKYRLPDPGKTRLHLRTKEPLSPSARAAPRSPTRRQMHTSGPSTPHTTQANGNWQQQSPIWPPGFSLRNASSESIVADSPAIDFAGRNDVSRAGSIYTLGRASLQDQLAHLTSLRLPDPTSLAKKISSIPTALEAAKALSDAAEQIRIWISKASEVLHSLSAEDDVEWAAAGGRDGIDDVDHATERFQNLVEVYVLSIERLQTREDVSALPNEVLQGSVKQMEGITGSWKTVKDTLHNVKRQVELAMEWEELWNSVLGEAGQEMEALNRLVFEMEEKRHQGTESLLSSKDSIDLHELETIVDRRPGRHASSHVHRLSLPGPFAPSSPPLEASGEIKDDASLLALFARMQPLRAALDFLPMRLLTFTARGNAVFPSACAELERRRDQLETQWRKLDTDAESLRRELGEDRWVLVFRNAGRQALKMEESITRSYNKLKEAVEAHEYQTSSSGFLRKLESYDAKKAHYGPAIERVLAIIDRGVQDRLTVNGEILRLQSDMKARWSALQADMRAMDLELEELDRTAGQSEDGEKQMRDSVSTVMSIEQRSVDSSLVETPGSSPASSVVGGGGPTSGYGSRTPTPLMLSKSRRSGHPGSAIPISIPRRIPLTKSGEFTALPSSSPLASRSGNNSRNVSTASQAAAASATADSSPGSSTRPRWQTPIRTEKRDFLPLSALEPSPYAKPPVVKHVNYLRSSSSPLSAGVSAPATTGLTPNRGGGKSSLSRKVSTPHLSSSLPGPGIKGTPPPPVPAIPSKATPTSGKKSALPVPAAAGGGGGAQTPIRSSALASRKSLSALRSSAATTTPSKPPAVPKLEQQRRLHAVPPQQQKHAVPGTAAAPAPTLRRTSAATKLTDGNDADTERIGSAVAPHPARFTDGNEADNEGPAHHKGRSSRPGSALSSSASAGGRRSVISRMRARAVSSLGEGVGGERPKWRP